MVCESRNHHTFISDDLQLSEQPDALLVEADEMVVNAAGNHINVHHPHPNINLMAQQQHDYYQQQHYYHLDYAALRMPLVLIGVALVLWLSFQVSLVQVNPDLVSCVKRHYEKEVGGGLYGVARFVGERARDAVVKSARSSWRVLGNPKTYQRIWKELEKGIETCENTMV